MADANDPTGFEVPAALKFQRAIMPYFAVWMVSVFLLFGLFPWLMPRFEGHVSETKIFGLPLFHGQGQFEAGVTTGVVAFGGLSVGVVAFGGLAVGLIAIGGGAIGVVAIGGGAVGIIASGGGALGFIAIGGGAVGYIAAGGGAVGVYSLGGGAFGRHVLHAGRQDPEAVRLFGKYLPRVRAAFGA